MGTDFNDREFREFTNPAGDTWREYKLDRDIALKIKDMCLGLNGERVHTWRALAIEVTGYEDQMTGSDLYRLAQWTLGENWDAPEERKADIGKCKTRAQQVGDELWKEIEAENSKLVADNAELALRNERLREALELVLSGRTYELDTIREALAKGDE